ncbi:M23 family metallopeptidase [Actinosynnema sp. NPDC047251]|uniref:M23ase beta-sheet core domain-containing protein n=1 Tax=Saccharothrix espanaensis (strain ATCC 51144 / DSM 44229 / JCM 9112 / NBRC 15066 / NRRL 15764) TaxID=1179773 RepID=K0K7H6_SACES|nr:M23 family metallopeptidase [Saccharothrix espanaensis]CCH34321.1 hypothetical protein BN6_70860 [Saccharothrix espanaensis DSM 44229]
MAPTIRTPLVQTLTVAVLLLSWPAHPAAAAPRHAWPLAPPPPVLRTFEPPPTPFRAGHRGVDLGAAEGTTVLASADGTVHFAGPVAGRHLVSLTHEGNLRTTYEPLIPLVKRGQQVVKGTPLGTLTPGHAGCRTPCLHWAALRPTPRRAYLDPLSLLSRPPVRLLPLPTQLHPTEHQAPSTDHRALGLVRNARRERTPGSTRPHTNP